MHSNLFLLFIIFSAPSIAYTQQSKPARYRDLIFTDANVDKNISYYSTSAVKAKDHLLDIYLPHGDTVILRPLVIWIHGGGFKFGSKKSRGIPIWSRDFAKRGYVCAAINYRRSKKKTLSQFPALVDGCYSAIEDLNYALIFLKCNYKQYGIDTNCIILGGNSAGAMVALQAGYAHSIDLAKLSRRTDTNRITSSLKDNNPANFDAIINMWGAIFDLSWLQNATIPLVSIHGDRDRVVPFNKEEGPLYGSYLIHHVTDSLHIQNALKVYEGYGHELQKHFIPFFAGTPAKQRWREAGEFAASFLYRVLFEK